MNELRVDVEIEKTANTLLEIMRQLGENSNKPYIIIEKEEDLFPIIASNKLYCELTQFVDEEIQRRTFQSIFVQNRWEKRIVELEQYLQECKMFTMEMLQKKKGGIFCSRIECLPFRHYYLVLIEDITTSQLDDYIKQLEQKMFLALEQKLPFTERISAICSEIDALFYPYSYTMVTLHAENELVTMLSDRFELFKQKQYTVVNKDEIAFYKKLMRQNQAVQIEDITAYAINPAIKQYVFTQHYENCWLVPLVSNDEVVGIMTLFFDVQKRDTAAYAYLGERLIEIIVTNYELNEQQLLIQQLINSDPVTNLPNRHHFKGILKVLTKQRIQGIVKIVEASEFSKIVELYGRDAGDELLKQLGERIRQNATSDIFHVARFTDSALIIFSTRDFQEVRSDLTPFAQLMTTPFQIGEIATYITLKSGFAAFNEDICWKDSMRFAEVALEKAKKTVGKNSEYYEGHMDIARQRELQIVNYLTEAIQEKEITTYFQPKIMLYRERVASVEALARWHSKELGFVSPAEFIPVAENAGLICEIDLLMLEQILQWMQHRLYVGEKIIPVAINISPVHFYHAEFVANVQRLLQKYYTDPNYLIIEVTESIGLADLKRAQRILRDLQYLGVRTSVDDFGIGYSSLSYLQKFSFQELKIDRSFTMKIHEVGTAAIIQAIIQIAHTLDMVVIAEGVETFEQAQKLKELGCDVAQGYYYYKPMPISDFEQVFDSE